MSDEFDRQQTDEQPVVPQPASETVASVTQPASAASPVPQTASSAPMQRRTGVWIAAVAAAAVLAVMLSAVSFGAGVFVGRQGGRFGAMGVADVAARGPQGMPGAQGMQGLPDRPPGRDMQGGVPGMGDDAQGGMPGMRGGRGFRGSPNGTMTVPPGVNQ